MTVAGGGPDKAMRELESQKLLPPAWDGRPAGVGLVSDAGVDELSKFKGALLAGAIGDALGRPAEGLPRHAVAERYGELRDFVPWRGWQRGPTGTFTDDTQLTICVAESVLVSNGILDPDDLAQRFVEWLPVGRGKGQATAAAVLRLQAGTPWYDAGEPSAGNGAAMRVAPIGLANLGDLNRMRTDAATSAVITHKDHVAATSAVAQAFLTAWCVCRAPGTLEPEELMSHLVVAMEGVHDPGAVGTWPGAGPEPVRLIDRLQEALRLKDRSPDEAFDRLYNGAFVLESLPAALWCFLRSPEEPEEVLITAVNGGRDADTVAAMAGTLAGAYMGHEALPSRWLEDLEEVERITGLATWLYGMVFDVEYEQDEWGDPIEPGDTVIELVEDPDVPGGLRPTLRTAGEDSSG